MGKKELEKGTSDKILDKDDIELGLEFLMKNLDFDTKEHMERENRVRDKKMFTIEQPATYYPISGKIKILEGLEWFLCRVKQRTEYVQ
jgi:hypothetical protein